MSLVFHDSAKMAERNTFMAHNYWRMCTRSPRVQQSVKTLVSARRSSKSQGCTSDSFALKYAAVGGVVG